MDKTMQNKENKAIDFDTIYDPKEKGVRKTSKKWKILSFFKKCPTMNTMKTLSTTMGKDKFLKTFKGLYETISNSFDEDGKRYEIKTANVTVCVSEDELAEYQGLFRIEGFVPEKVGDAFDHSKIYKKNK